MPAPQFPTWSEPASGGKNEAPRPAPMLRPGKRPQADPAAGEAWSDADNALQRLEFAVEHGLGQATVREALAETAEVLSRVVDRPTDQHQPASVIKWQRRLRGAVNADGSSLDRASMIALKGDIGAAQARLDMVTAATGLRYDRDAGDEFVLKTQDGARLLGLPRLTGLTVTGDMERFKPQLRLLEAGMKADDPGRLESRALHLFSALHERDHGVADGALLYSGVEARANAFVSAVEAVKRARTPADKAQAEALLRTTLFAEAAPGKRLAAFALDIMPGTGNANSADEFVKEFNKLQTAIAEGRADDAAIAGFWSIIDGVGAVGGIRFGKILTEVSRTTPLGRRLVAARYLARTEANGPKKLKAYKGEAILGPKRWAKLTQEQKNYLDSLFRLAKGRVDEAQMSKNFRDVGASSWKNMTPGEQAAYLRQSQSSNKPHVVDMLPQHGGETRNFDDALIDTTLKRHLGFFVFPEKSVGSITAIEKKSGSAQKTLKQKKNDFDILDNEDLYPDRSIALLRTPYEHLPKKQIRDTVISWMRDPDLSGHKYITTGKIARGYNGEYRTVKWNPRDLEKMIKDVEISLNRQSIKDEIPTLFDFLIGISSRISSSTDSHNESHNQ